VTGEKLQIGRPARAVGLAVTLLLAGLELAALLGPWEDWPFSSAPMFARHQSRDAPVYYIEWWVDAAGGSRLLSPQKDLGLGELPFRRGYFASFYGSADPRHPGGHFPDDDPAAFEQRQHDYCRRLSTAFRRPRASTLPSFRLVVAEERAGRRTRSREVGRCEAARFRSSP
jgi:hypothetical protein